MKFIILILVSIVLVSAGEFIIEPMTKSTTKCRINFPFEKQDIKKLRCDTIAGVEKVTYGRYNCVIEVGKCFNRDEVMERVIKNISRRN
jgi:hypothetical protein